MPELSDVEARERLAGRITVTRLVASRSIPSLGGAGAMAAVSTAPGVVRSSSSEVWARLTPGC